MWYARFLVLASLVVALAGCLSVTPGGIMEAARFDPLTTNPADFGAGLGVPDTIRLSDGDAMMMLTYSVAGEAGPRVNERFVLEVAESTGVAGTPTPNSDERIYVARLSHTDVLRMKDVQARIQSYKLEGIEGKGSFSIGLQGGCATRLPLTTLPVRTFMRTRSGSPHVEIMRRTDLLARLPAIERKKVLGSIRTCEQTG